jgi:Polyketide cyclase / dehydrase and lipid transport
MPEQASQAVTIAAQPAEILAVIGDFASYPEWADSVAACEVLSRHADGSADRVRFVVDAGMFQDDYVLAYTWDDSHLRVDWDLVSSSLQTAQTGSYLLVPQGHESEVVYALSIDLSVPMLALFKRRAEKAIMDIALRSLKKRVEGGR